MTAENATDDAVSELAAGILGVLAGEALAMSILVTVGPVGGNDTTV